MNDKLKELFGKAIVDCVMHQVNHFNEIAEHDGQDVALEKLEEAMEASALMGDLHLSEIRPMTLKEQLMESAWGFTCIFLDLQDMGAFVITGEDGKEVITCPPEFLQ